MRAPVIVSLLFVSVLGLGSGGALADAKVVSPGASCIALAPDSTAAELQFSATGIYNPGTTTEKVLCALPRDQYVEYGATQLNVFVRWRVLGATASTVACTLYVGSSMYGPTPVFTHTSAGPARSSGAQGLTELKGVGSAASYGTPVNLVCAIPPKTWLSSIDFLEGGETG